MRWRVSALLPALLLGAAAVRGADLRLSPLYTDNLVLPHDRPVAVLGAATAGARITVTFAGQTKKTVADRAGFWVVELDPLPASPAGRALQAATVGRTCVVTNVTVGAPGPFCEHARSLGNRFQVMFAGSHGGLHATDTNDVPGFAIAGSDRVFAPARARIVGETVSLTSGDVKVPVAARYCWNPDAHTPGLFNTAGQHAIPFRTDSWPLERKTAGK